eukprot:6201985-Pleurochrysis_carterae.AAC.4
MHSSSRRTKGRSKVAKRLRKGATRPRERVQQGRKKVAPISGLCCQNLSARGCDRPTDTAMASRQRTEPSADFSAPDMHACGPCGQRVGERGGEGDTGAREKAAPTDQRVSGAGGRATQTKNAGRGMYPQPSTHD